MTKVISFTCLHYGKSYLGYALQSVIDSVDEAWILYSAIGSHGFRTDVPCPESRDDLLAIAQAVAGNKLRWREGEWTTEGNQRDSIFTYTPDADVILVVDSDEIWPWQLVEMAIDTKDMFSGRHIRRHRMPIIHYWRSFYRAVLHDPAYPERVIYPKAPEGKASFEDRAKLGQFYINHMGYAQPASIVEYKQLTHGHRGEWRKNWFRDKFMANAQVDCHPVGSQYWNPEPVDPWQYMPAFMKYHPFAQMEVIP